MSKKSHSPCTHSIYFLLFSLKDIEIERMLGGKNSVQGPLLLKLLFAGLKTMPPLVTAKHHAHCNIHCVPFKVSIMC